MLISYFRVTAGMLLATLFIIFCVSEVPAQERTPRPPNPPVHRSASSKPAPSQPTRTPSKRTASGSLSLRVEEAISRGNYERDARNYTQAEKYYKRALALNPREARAYFGLGNVYGDEAWDGDHETEVFGERAISAYQQAIRLQPGFVQAYFDLGYQYYLRGGQFGSYEEAVDPFKLGIRLDPDNIDAHKYLGFTYNQLSRYAEAAEQFMQMIRLKRDDPAGYEELGTAEYNQQHYTEAVRQLKRSIELKSTSGYTLYYLGMAYLKLNDKNAALEQYQEMKRRKSVYADGLLKEINKQ